MFCGNRKTPSGKRRECIKKIKKFQALNTFQVSMKRFAMFYVNDVAIENLERHLTTHHSHIYYVVTMYCHLSCLSASWANDGFRLFRERDDR